MTNGFCPIDALCAAAEEMRIFSEKGIYKSACV
jgi:hypothetical protein